MPDIREARFYVVDEDNLEAANIAPLEFEVAFEKANTLTENGRRIKVLYTDDASQLEITRFVSHGIMTELASGG